MKRLPALQKVIELQSFSKSRVSTCYTQSAISHMIASFRKRICD